ncbi:MAG TPA: hypothetical protein VG477_19790 [Thermoanaerobaculia bacterium]|nr:hypothetical protein [Thermoanaerobaculia bacterium]
MLRRPLSTALLSLAFHLVSMGAAVAAPVELAAGPGDDELVRIGKSIPGFGGYFYDEEGRPTVYLLDPGAVGPVAKSLGPDVRVLRGDYEFAELVGWRLELRPLLGLRGVVFLDVDETTNRVVLGVDSTSETKSLDRDRLERELLFRNVPREAVVVRETAPIRELLGVQDKFRPTPGGVQINFLNLLCTLGFNATRGNVSGFVTNSHCSTVRGESDGTRYFQNLPNTGTIGTELFDPANITDSRCPAGRKCRFSDSTFVKYDKKSLGNFAKIVRPTGERSLVINPSAARFTIKRKAGGAVAGQVVNKVGRTTGWTSGVVIATCTDFSSAITEFTLFCQGAARTFTAGGDSGSPVFIRTKRNDVTLVGLLWGGGTDGAGNTIFAYSPLENIEAELGPLKVF